MDMQKNRQISAGVESASKIKGRRESEKHRDGDCGRHHNKERIPPSRHFLCTGNHGYPSLLIPQPRLRTRDPLKG
jgi:hypothetical protein